MEEDMADEPSVLPSAEGVLRKSTLDTGSLMSALSAPLAELPVPSPQLASLTLSAAVETPSNMLDTMEEDMADEPSVLPSAEGVLRKSTLDTGSLMSALSAPLAELPVPSPQLASLTLSAAVETPSNMLDTMEEDMADEPSVLPSAEGVPRKSTLDTGSLMSALSAPLAELPMPSPQLASLTLSEAVESSSDMLDTIEEDSTKTSMLVSRLLRRATGVPPTPSNLGTASATSLQDSDEAWKDGFAVSQLPHLPGMLDATATAVLKEPSLAPKTSTPPVTYSPPRLLDHPGAFVPSMLANKLFPRQPPAKKGRSRTLATLAAAVAAEQEAREASPGTVKSGSAKSRPPPLIMTLGKQAKPPKTVMNEGPSLDDRTMNVLEELDARVERLLAERRHVEVIEAPTPKLAVPEAEVADEGKKGTTTSSFAASSFAASSFAASSFAASSIAASPIAAPSISSIAASSIAA
ncbi:hypothetical protein CALCODRAFT_483060 [Calocera cornea HHB12733]|uniref:Uncharacterized protein n=1 Tax=Calocera cornea HHB12733 TaxID=1353952 RepID=A0A165G529_9BASI|nr:hypothetical protein CALCODRAFT_483060 [Calocera cornea HHB12733]